MIGISTLQTTFATGVNFTSAQTIGAYAHGAGNGLLRPRLRLSSLNAAAATITVRLRNTTDASDVWSTAVSKGVATDTAVAILLPSFYAPASKSHSLIVQSTNASDTAARWDIDWFDAQQADVHAVNASPAVATALDAMATEYGAYGSLNVNVIRLNGDSVALSHLYDLAYHYANGTLYTSIAGDVGGNVSGAVGSVLGVSFDLLSNLDDAVSGRASQETAAEILNHAEAIPALSDLMVDLRAAVEAIGLANPGTGDGDTLVDHHTGGVDQLRYTTSGGAGIDGADVIAYLSGEYAAGVFVVRGRTVTRADGRWVQPLKLNSGLTYTIRLEKDGSYGPDTKELVIP